MNFVPDTLGLALVTGTALTLREGVCRVKIIYMEALRQKPLALWRLDDTSPFTDYSGYARSGVVTGTEVKGISLTSDALYSQLFDRTHVGTFACPVYRAGSEAQTFSLAASVYPIVRTENNVVQAYRENLALDPSMENPAGGTQSSSSTTLYPTTYDTPTRLFGGRSVTWIRSADTPSVTIASGYLTAPAYTNSTALKVKAGDQISYSVWVRCSVPFRIRPAMLWRNSLSSTVLTEGARPISSDLPANQWVLLKGENFVAPEGAEMALIRADFIMPSGGTTVGGEQAWADGLLVNYGPTVSGGYFDGSMPGYEWSGSPNQSISRTRVDVSQVNLATNPSFETTLNPWSGISATITQSTDWSSSGTNSMKVTPTGTTDSFAQIGASTNNLLGMIPGETYTISGTIRLGAAQTGTLDPTRARRIVIYSWNSGTLVGASTISAARGNSPGFTRLSVNYTVPEGVNGITIRLYNGAALGGGDVYWDNFSIVKGTDQSTYFDGDSVGSMWLGTANNSESVLLPSNAPVQILSNTGHYDGLTIDGRTIAFSTKYTNTGEAKCSYTMEAVRKADIVGVHTQTKNSLYIDNELVAEVDITPEQQSDTYISSDPNLYTGASNSSGGVFINNLSVYPQPLQVEAVRSLSAANNRRALGSVPKMFGGDDVPLGPSVRVAYLDTGWSSDEDWESASLFDVVADNDQLHATMENGLTRAGTWIDSVDLYAGETPSPINSINLWWSGVNETVEASIDGETWVAVQKGVNLSIIPAGFDPTDKALHIRVSFPAGRDEAYVESMQVRGYLTNTAVSNGRTITYNNVSVLFNEAEPAMLRDDAGVRINSGGSITIGADTNETPAPIRTIELWIKPSVTQAGVYGTTWLAGYKNGTPATSSTLTANEWVLYHRVISPEHTGPITIDTPGQIAKVALYEDALTAAQVQSIYNNYTGVDKVVQDGTGIISIAESPTSTKIYAHDWEILTA